MTPPKPTRADAVEVRQGAEKDFRKRHRNNRAVVEAVWKSLVKKGGLLQADVHYGSYFTPPKCPGWLRDVRPLYVLKGLPEAFRAIYTVEYQSPGRAVVVVEWVGDHNEYDALFGYTTS